MTNTQSKPDTAARHAIPQLVRWCPTAQTHQDVDDALCNWSNCGGRYETHRLRKRQMLICSTCQ